VTLGVLCDLMARMLELEPTYKTVDQLLGTSYVENRSTGKRAAKGCPSVENIEKEQFLVKYLAENELPDYFEAVLREALDVVRKEMEGEISPATW